MCVISLVLKTTQYGTVILQMGIMRHRHVNLPKVTELEGMQLGFRPSQFGSKAMPLTTILTAAYLTVLPTCPPDFIASSRWSKILLKYRLTPHVCFSTLL